MRDICTPTQSKYNHLEIFLAFEKIMFLTHLLLLHSSNTKVERNKKLPLKFVLPTVFEYKVKTSLQ